MEKEAEMQFPTVTARNLLRHQVTLPDDFEGEWNVLLIAFQQRQQSLIDTWLPFVQQLEQTGQGVVFYELPVIQRLNMLARTFINEGMRAGIPDRLARERTITLYIDKAVFRQTLGLPHEEDIYVLLVDRQGRVLWRSQGAFTPEKGEALAQAVQEAR
jgi:hypothetical protein